MTTKKELLSTPIQHIDISAHNVVSLVDAMASMAYTSRDTGARGFDLREDAARQGVRGDPVPGGIADLCRAAEGVC